MRSLLPHAWAPRTRRIVGAMLVVPVLLLVAAIIPVAHVVYDVHHSNQALSGSTQEALDEPAGEVRTILVLGSDASRSRRDRPGSAFGTTDAMMLVRIDPRSAVIDLLSIPRDYYVDAEKAGEGERLGSAFARGGPRGAVVAVRDALDVRINHVLVIDFDGFRSLVDALGTVRIDNPYMVRSGETFDGRAWVFPRGVLQLDGRQSLAYARIRRVDRTSQLLNRDEEGEAGRLTRQQRVLEAVVSAISPRDLMRHPISLPHALLEPVATDIGVRELTTWARAFRHAGTKSPIGRRCRLGGTYEDRGANTVLVPDGTRAAVVRAFERRGPGYPMTPPSGGGCIEYRD